MANNTTITKTKKMTFASTCLFKYILIKGFIESNDHLRYGLKRYKTIEYKFDFHPIGI